MELDDDLCLCFHVSKRKVLNFIRVQRPQRVGQLADCFGAGTGCGWCRPFLRRLFEEAAASGAITSSMPTPEEYAAMRAAYLKERESVKSGNDPDVSNPSRRQDEGGVGGAAESDSE
jgi:NAD(P)H-nitrite reductase large subunit